MPGSTTAPGRQGTRDDAPHRIAFHRNKSVGTQDDVNFAAQWLAYARLCQRFARSSRMPRRMTRGQRDSLLLRCEGLAPFTPCRFFRRTDA
jgi:hypothetical protein